jgi:hypothetical protein
LLTRPGYSDSYQDFPFDFASPSPVRIQSEVPSQGGSVISEDILNSLQGITNRQNNCPPNLPGCENKVDKQLQFLPLNSANQESDINVDNNEIMYTQKRPNDNYIVSSLSLAKEHRKLLSILPPVGHPSLSDSIANSRQQSFSSLESTIVRGGPHWNSKFGETSGSSSKFTAVIFTQLSAASSVVRYNAPIFKLVSNVASSEYVEKVSKKMSLLKENTYCT